MAEPTYENAIKAMRKAYDAGDIEAAKRMAALAKSLEGQQGKPAPSEGFLGQMNAGISQAFDTMRTPIRMVDRAVNAIAGREMVPQTPSTAETFRGIGAMVAEGEPDTITGAMGRGAGLAAGYAPLFGLTGTALSTLPGAYGQAANVATRSLSTVPAFGTEMLAGALSEGGAEVVDKMGGGEAAQNIARIAAPMSIPAAGAVGRQIGRAAENLPLVGAASRTTRDAVRAFAPMTKTGAREVAREELLRRAGSRERLTELGERINPQDPYGRTAAQMTGDPEFMGLEEAVKRTYPTVRVDLDAQTQRAGEAFRNALRTEGSGLDAQAFFRKYLDDRVTSVLKNADAKLPQGRSPSSTSVRVVSQLKAELSDQLLEERELWAAVPREVVAAPNSARAVAKRWEAELGQARRSDMPELARRLLLSENGYGDIESAGELHGLYSKLREIARNARAGTQTRPTLAKVADEIADGILRDLDAVEAPTSELGQRLKSARAFSRQVHEKFDQGAVGRILKRTVTGDEAMTPEAALRRTVGVGNEEGAAAADSLLGAAPTTRGGIEDYLQTTFSDAIIGPDGAFTPRRAATWLRQNQETLNQFPALKRDLQAALRNRQNAESLVARFKASTIAGLTDGPADKAVTTILSARDPATAARSVIATAKKDPSGKALAGIKAAFSDRLISQTVTQDGVLSGRGLQSLLRDGKMRAALRQAFSADEIRNMERIANAVADMQVAPSGAEEIINAPVNALLKRVVQIAAAQQGGRMGASSNMGGSLQTANIMSRYATKMLENLTNTRAREMLVDAVQDPQLMRALMLNETATLPKQVMAKFAPYLAGASATVLADE